MKKNVTGVLIFVSIILTLYSNFIDKDMMIFAIVCFWLSLGVMFKELNNKNLLISLSVLGGIVLVICLLLDYKINPIKLFGINQNMIVLLVSVGFLKLIATPKFEKMKSLPKGKKAYFQTYLGVHFFGAVINISAMIIIADKLYKNAKLSFAQIITIQRAFSTDALWSIFFVAFAAASTYAPKLDLVIVTLSGIGLSFLVFLYTSFEMFKAHDIENFIGYPLSFQTLYIPLVLSAVVLFAHYFYKGVQIITLISFFSLFLSISVLFVKEGLKGTFGILARYIKEELPNMKGEISLFLVAGFFGMSVSFLLLGMDYKLPFEVYDYKVASLFLAVFLVLGFFGIHPIISIAIVSDLLHNANHTLLAINVLMAWSLNVTNSPLSGVNLSISSRYSVNAMDIFKLNLRYTILFYFICVFVLYLISKSLNIS